MSMIDLPGNLMKRDFSDQMILLDNIFQKICD